MGFSCAAPVGWALHWANPKDGRSGYIGMSMAWAMGGRFGRAQEPNTHGVSGGGGRYEGERKVRVQVEPAVEFPDWNTADCVSVVWPCGGAGGGGLDRSAGSPLAARPRSRPLRRWCCTARPPGPRWPNQGPRRGPRRRTAPMSLPLSVVPHVVGAAAVKRGAPLTLCTASVTRHWSGQSAVDRTDGRGTGLSSGCPWGQAKQVFCRATACVAEGEVPRGPKQRS